MSLVKVLALCAAAAAAQSIDPELAQHMALFEKKIYHVAGNVYSAVCFLEGLALEEVDAKKLEVLDASYPVIVTVRARKPEQA